MRATALLLLALTACGGESLFPTGNSPGIDISLSSNTLTIAQGTAGSVTVTLNRRNGFEGAVTVTVEGLPSGASAAALSLTAGQTTGTLTLNVAATAAAGTSALTVRATGLGVSASTASLSLAVQAAAGGFTLSLSATTLDLPRGGQASVTITIGRSGSFSGAVALSATGLPAGVSASFNPASVTGTTSMLTLSATASAATGSASVAVGGNASGVPNRTATLSLTVQPTGGGTVSATFCPATGIPIWVAFQDGPTGSWVRATGASGVYSGQVSSGRGGIAYVTSNATGGFTTTVRYGTTSELNDFNAVYCYGSSGAGKTVEYSLIGAGTNHVALGLGTATAVAPSGTPTAPFQNVPDGTVDLIAARSAVVSTGLLLNRLVAHRDLTPAAGSRVAVNFNGEQAVDPVTAPLTIAGLGSDQAFVNFSYRTANRTLILYASDAVGFSTSRTIAGFPAVTGSFHQARVIASPIIGGSDRIRSADVVFVTVAPKTITLGPEMGGVTVSSAATTPTLRPQAVIPAVAPYHQSWNFTMSQGTGAQFRSATVQMTSGYLAATPATVTLVVPDLSTVAGYLVDWGLRNAVSMTWSAVGQSTTGFGPQGSWADGATTLFAGRLGSLAP